MKKRTGLRKSVVCLALAGVFALSPMTPVSAATTHSSVDDVIKKMQDIKISEAIEQFRKDVPRYENVMLRGYAYPSATSYSLKNSVVEPDGSPSISYDETVYIGRSLLHNNSNVEQEMTTQSFQETITDTVSTSTTRGVGTSVTAKSSFSIPFTGSTDISMTASYNFSENTTETNSKAVTIKVEPQRVTVPANSSIEVLIYLNKASISGNVLLKGELVGTETGEITIQANNAFWGWIFADSESYSIDVAQMAKEKGQSMGIEPNSDGSVNIVGRGTYEASIGAELVVQINNLTTGETGSTVLDGIPVSDKSGAGEYPSEVQYQSAGILNEDMTQPGTETPDNNRYVTIMKDGNYQGASQKLGPGIYHYSEFGAVGNDALSSIVVPPGMKAILYENENLIGLHKVVTSSTDFSRTYFNDMTSLIEVIDLTGETAEKKVTLFQDANYRGASQDLSAGQGVKGYTFSDFETIGNDKLSSIYVREGIKVILYENANFTGKQKVITENTDLCRGSADFNDKASAMKIIDQSVEQGEEVILFKNANYSGASRKVGAGRYTCSEFSVIGDNALSSIYVPEGMKVILYANKDFTGQQKVITSATNWNGGDFNDKASAIEIIKIDN